MCRIFLLWKSKNVTDKELKQMLKHSRHRDPPHENYESGTATDGYGVAGFSNQTHRWNLYKTEKIYDTDPHFSRVLDTFTQYSFIIGHMRENPKWSTVRIENNHPFYYKNHVFLQYGDISGLETPRKRNALIRTLLPEFVPNIHGTTDSELLFYLFLTKCRENTILLPHECSHAITFEDTSSSVITRTPTLLRSSGVLKFRQIYENDRMHYKPLYLLYMSMMKTLEYLHKHFPKITTNIIYSNKQYTMVLRHRYAKPSHKHTTHNTLYWNNPMHNGQKHIIITTRPTKLSKTLIPDDTLVFIENTTGKTFVFC
jgi:predicted glutamine amidotransferase